MLLELVSRPETDIIAALEGKYAKSRLLPRFEEDPRVNAALISLAGKEHRLEPCLENLYDQLTFLDNAWMMTYLMRIKGHIIAAEQIRNNLHACYDPFKSYNSVAKGFAYCEAIDNAAKSVELEQVVERMGSDIGKSENEILQRMYPLLTEYAHNQISYFSRIEKYAKEMINRICKLVSRGDKLVRQQEFSEAAEQYDLAAEIAEYQLRRPELAKTIHSRISNISCLPVNGVYDDTIEDKYVEGDSCGTEEKKEKKEREEAKKE